MNGDCGLLDQIALTADKRLGTKLCSGKYVSPTYRHQRVLNALESQRGKQLFTKVYDKHTRERVFRLKGTDD